MAIADNATYKDQYFFKTGDQYDSTFGENPSLNIEDDVNYTIKTNPYRANVEIEGREVVLNPELDGIFDAKGKRHHKGGMPVQLKPGSFVFSDHTPMALSKDEQEVLELKQGYSSKKKDNTPAQVLKRNIDLEHYNKLVNNLNDPKKNLLAKSSSELMLKKYREIVGKVAFAQESKKGFSDGIPEFAKDSAPVYNDEIKDEIMAQKQYAKYGGSIKNPYKEIGNSGLRMMQKAGVVYELEPYKGDKDPWNASKISKDDWIKFSDEVGFTDWATQNKVRLTNENFQTYLANHSDYKDIVRDIHEGIKDKSGKLMIDPKTGRAYTKYGRTASGKIVDNMLGIRWDDFYKMVHKVPPPNTVGTITDTTTLPPVYIEPPVQKQIEVKPQDYMPVKWEFTPWQKLSQLYNLGRVANIKRYMPYRSQYEPKYASLPLYNPEPMIADAIGVANQAIRSLNTLNPILRNAQAQQLVGNNIDLVNRIRADYDNKNVGQKTNEEMTNTQLRNQSLLTNINFDQQYYREAVTSSANYDKAKQVANDLLMNNIMQDVATNQSLAYQLASLRDPAWTYDFKTGNFKRLPKNILDVMASNSKSSYLDPYIRSINFSGLSDRDKIQFLKVLMAKDFQPQPGFSQKGGTIKGNMKRNPYV